MKIKCKISCADEFRAQLQVLGTDRMDACNRGVMA